MVADSPTERTGPGRTPISPAPAMSMAPRSIGTQPMLTMSSWLASSPVISRSTASSGAAFTRSTGLGSPCDDPWTRSARSSRFQRQRLTGFSMGQTM